MVYITRKETFSAAHKLTRPDWSLEKNEEVFGKCSNPNWHGHNYQLWVTVKGEINPETGFVTNLAEISLLLKHYVLDKVDHKNLNMDVDFMKESSVPQKFLQWKYGNKSRIRLLNWVVSCIQLKFRKQIKIL